MPTKKKSSVAALILDTIETSCGNEFSPNLNNINGFEACKAEELSIDLSNYEYYKKLSEDIAHCLYCFAPSYVGDTFFLHDKDGNIVVGDTLKSKVSPLRDAAFKIECCGTRLGFDNDGELRTANFCRLRVCPMCQRRRSLKIGAEFNRIMEHLNCSWVHLVLTVPNCEDWELSDLLDTMQTCSSRLFRMEFVKKAFKGLARCTEVTYNYSADSYHPHFHCLVAVNKSYFTSRDYINILFLRKVWTVIFTAAWWRGVNVRHKSDGYFLDLVEDLQDGDIIYQCHIGKADAAAVSEIAKYAVKPLEIGLQGEALYKPLAVIYEALHSRRLIQTFGTVKTAASALRVDFDTIEDERELDRTDVRLYNWDRSLKRYSSELS